MEKKQIRGQGIEDTADSHNVLTAPPGQFRWNSPPWPRWDDSPITAKPNLRTPVGPVRSDSGLVYCSVAYLYISSLPLSPLPWVWQKPDPSWIIPAMSF